ncbi:MAG: hypothetical protein HYX67_08595 [Candidatus Melainabacteria bacterium]|nr:hypothetical protein [Candidatus Melainabacteria bacterium]
MKTKGLVIATTAAMSLVVGCVTLFPAYAAPNGGMDVFSNVTPGNRPTTQRKSAAAQIASMTPSANPVGQGAMAMMSTSSPALTWFEKFDEVSFSLQPSDTDKIILKKNFNQEAERVVQWTKTAAKVAHNYRLLAQTLKTAYVPPNHPALKDYQVQMSDWYNDKAAVYEDLIRPRAAAKTIEELEEQLKEISDRADSIASQGKELHALDFHLRETYRVHQSRQTDQLQHYVRNELPNYVQALPKK